jgi:hypothetical protein
MICRKVVRCNGWSKIFIDHILLSDEFLVFLIDHGFYLINPQETKEPRQTK